MTGRAASGPGLDHRRARARTGATLVEMLVALCVASAVLGALLALWRVGERMNRAAQSSAAIQAALTLQESIFQDLRQMGLDPASPDVVLGGGGAPGSQGSSISFFKAVFVADRVALRPVRYRLIPSPGGNRFLARDEVVGGQTRTHVFGPCPLRSADFEVSSDAWGNRYIRASLAVLADDRVPGAASIEPERIVFQQVLVKEPVPEYFGDSRFDKVNAVMKEAPLLPP